MSEIYLDDLICYYSKSTGDTFMEFGDVRTNDDVVLIGLIKGSGCISAMSKPQLTEYIAVLNKVLDEKEK